MPSIMGHMQGRTREWRGRGEARGPGRGGCLPCVCLSLCPLGSYSLFCGVLGTLNHLLIFTFVVVAYTQRAPGGCRPRPADRHCVGKLLPGPVMDAQCVALGGGRQARVMDVISESWTPSSAFASRCNLQSPPSIWAVSVALSPRQTAGCTQAIIRRWPLIGAAPAERFLDAQTRARTSSGLRGAARSGRHVGNLNAAARVGCRPRGPPRAA